MWIESNNLVPVSNLSSIQDINTNDGSSVELFSWFSEDECVGLYHYKVNGGGHDWPGTFGNMDIVSHEIIWEHLSEYGMNGKLDCNSTNNNSSCPEDLDFDGYITIQDLLLILSDFGCDTACENDITQDGYVAVDDLLQVLSEFGNACE